MNYQKLARQINKRIHKGIKTDEDKKECVKLDEQLLTFARMASEEEIEDFRRRCYCLEIFAMIAAGLAYEEENK